MNTQPEIPQLHEHTNDCPLCEAGVPVSLNSSKQSPSAAENDQRVQELKALTLLRYHAHPGCPTCKGAGVVPKIVKEGRGKKSAWVRIKIPCICATLSMQREELLRKQVAASKAAEAAKEPEFVDSEEKLKPHVNVGTLGHNHSMATGVLGRAAASPAFTFKPHGQT